jgi:hypothetical protein
MGESVMMDSDGERAAFLLVEYREAANAYFKGVDIGWNGLKFYITLNGFFATIIGVFTGRQEHAIIAATDIINLSPIVVLGLSAAFVLILPHYFKHLENCRQRCEQIEIMHGGQLFTDLEKIRRDKINAIPVVISILLSIALLWSVVAYHLWISPTS